jgi:hypothetical protein
MAAVVVVARSLLWSGAFTCEGESINLLARHILVGDENTPDNHQDLNKRDEGEQRKSGGNFII